MRRSIMPSSILIHKIFYWFEKRHSKKNAIINCARRPQISVLFSKISTSSLLVNEIFTREKFKLLQ